MSSNNGGASRSIRRHVLTAMTVGILAVSGLGGWAMTTELSGAVVASGLLGGDSNVQKVQHPTRGGGGGGGGRARACGRSADPPRRDDHACKPGDRRQRAR